MSKPINIVLVEDNPSDIWALKLAAAQEGLTVNFTVISTGEQALYFIEDTPATVPDLLILDLNLPRHSGHEVLHQWQSSQLKHVPVLIVTSSDSPTDRRLTAPFTPYYFRKPFDFDEYMKVGGIIRAVLSGITFEEVRA